jgi:hypothetical protein
VGFGSKWQEQTQINYYVYSKKLFNCSGGFPSKIIHIKSIKIHFYLYKISFGHQNKIYDFGVTKDIDRLSQPAFSDDGFPSISFFITKSLANPFWAKFNAMIINHF